MNLESRVVFRLSKDERSMIEMAADTSGQPLSAFICASALNSAREILAKLDIVQLYARDSERIMAAMDKPFQPTLRMAKALKRLEVVER